MANFKEALSYCELSDIPNEGQKFTWSNNKQGAEFTKEKLDRVVANPSAMNIFPGSFYIVLPQIKSDHSPIIINLSKNEASTRQRKYIFIF